MLLDGHNLDGVIAVGDDARQHVDAELLIGTHTLAVLSHANVALIDEQGLNIRCKLLDLELIGSLGRPHLGRENVSLLILNHSGGVCRNALAFPTLPVDTQLVQVAVAHCALGQHNLPVAVLETLEAIGSTLAPIVELAHEIDFGRIGCPFAEYPALACAVQAIIVISVGKLHKITRATRQLFYLVHSVLMTSIDGVAIRLQPGIIIDDCKILSLSHNGQLLN